ncbi:Major Facilitator Superfamily protein [Aspergillus niger]|uniref:Major Facilitator Superfamily protein n=1 Tax=Aspergillus niger TaxID=5061 RepID=A0A505I8G9_ASPNG|nr:Major Facilitator Superfamily protein [Aspergillus niger]
MAQEPTIHSQFEPNTGTWQYIVADPSTSKAVIIDPVLDYDSATQVISTSTADSLLVGIEEKNYSISYILETHAHADHLTAASYLASRISQKQGFRPSIGIGKHITQVQQLFGSRFQIPAEEYEGVFDKLWEDGETFKVGSLTATAMHLPGHTPDHLGYKIGDNVFCGDSLFHADIGTARCDFPNGSAQSLYHSVQKLLSLPNHVRIWTGHDYPNANRTEPVPWLTVRDHRTRNKHVNDDVTEEQFLALRQERDATLRQPKLLNPSLQVNIRAGRLPRKTESGMRMLHLPLKTLTRQCTGYLTEQIREDLTLESQLLLLSFAIGIQDAAAWKDYGCFASNQTGNMLFLAIGGAGLASNDDFDFTYVGMSLGSFVAGGLVMGQFANYLGVVRMRWWLLFSSLLQTVMVFAAAAIMAYTNPVKQQTTNDPPALVTLFLLAFSSGAQVSMGRALKVTDITTAMATAAYIDVVIDPE